MQVDSRRFILPQLEKVHNDLIHQSKKGLQGLYDLMHQRDRLRENQKVYKDLIHQRDRLRENQSRYLLGFDNANVNFTFTYVLQYDHSMD